MTKGNLKSAAPITIEDNTRRVEFARDCHGRQRNAAAEAAAHGYLLYRDTQVGETGEISWAMTNPGADEQLTAQIPRNRRISVYWQEIMA